MKLNRRSLLQSMGGGLLAAAFLRELGSEKSWASQTESGVKVGMCDWNLGGSCKPELIPRAKEAGLDGLQVSVGTSPDHIPLRDPAVRERYLSLGKEYGIQVCSTAAGSILNRIPLATEPQSAIFVLDAVEAAKALGASCILIAFFGHGDLRLRDSTGELRDISQNPPWRVWELDTQKVTRVVEVLRQLIPRAEDAGVILGLENTLSAAQNLEIIDRAGGSEFLQVYYDVGNSWANGYDVPGEIRMLGKERICEVHLKDPKSPVLGSPEGMVDMAACAKAFKEIGYEKWYVLETSGRNKRFLPDTQANVAFAKETFG